MGKKFFIVVITCALIFSAASLAAREEDKNKKNALFRQVELFSDALAIIQTDYVSDVSPKDLIYGALKGMLSALDAHSQFMDPETYNELKVDTEGKFGGLGIEITIQDGLLTVITPIEDTPAWNAGIKANDRIVKINKEITRDMSLTDAVKRMRGKPGDPVTLIILRESEKKILEFKIVRDIIKIQDIKTAKILEDGIAYIRLVEFRENTDQDMDTALANLKKEGMNALILDLRNNPGGLLDAAAAVCEKFIPKDKIIVSTKGRKKNQNMEISSTSNTPLLNLPMVVLINEGSASGSEIVAGCLQDYKRAIIVGIKSFGKGSVQSVVPLSDGSALRLTTSKYFTPLGREIHGKGVIPDVVVEAGLIEGAGKAGGENADKERVEEIFEQVETKAQPENKAKQPDFRNDNQLSRAVDILKAIKIYEEKGNKGGA
jgi:carboxyl-terminal processing protease